MKKKLVVGLDLRDLRIAKTGAKTFLEEICRSLQKCQSEDLKVVLIGTSIPVYTGTNKVLKLVEQGRFLVWKQLVLPIKAFSKGCNILFCTDYFVPYMHLGFKPIPVFHDAFFWEYPHHYNKYWLFIFRALGVLAAKRSPVIVVPSFYAKQQILKFAPFEAQKLVVIPEALKSSLTQKASPLNKTSTPAKFILHVGTFERRKNLPFLIKAYSLLLKNGHGEYKLVLAGQSSPKKDMDDTETILNTINILQLENHVSLPGYLSEEDLKVYYERAAMYVFPSLNEGFGLPILEAFYHNLPLLIANNSCLREIAGEAALSFDPSDVAELSSKMKFLIEDENLKLDLVKKGKERLQLYSWERTAEKLIDVFKKVASKN